MIDPLATIMTVESLIGPFDKYLAYAIMMDEALRIELISYEEWVQCEKYLYENRGFPRNVVDTKVLDNLRKLNGDYSHATS